MNQTATAVVATFLLAGVFPLLWPRRVIDERLPWYRSFISFAAGVSLAYVFIDLLPEFSGMGDELLREEAVRLPIPEYVVYIAALLGFVLFYGLERLVRWSRRGRSEEEEREAEETEELADFRIKIVGMAAYAGLVLYLMTAGIRSGSEEGLIVYVIAMLFHFVAVKHSLRYEYPQPYARAGRWVLFFACIAGGLLGLVLEASVGTEAVLLGFLGGMLIMNTTVMELPSEKEGRFGMFFLGSVLYAVLLLVR